MHLLVSNMNDVRRESTAIVSSGLSFFLSFNWRVECSTCDQQVADSNPTRGKSCVNNLRKVVDTYVPLLPRSITWYRPRGGDALRLGM